MHTVDSHVNLLGLAEAADRVDVVALEPDTQAVVAVQRKVVPEGKATARSERQIFVHPVVLHHERRDLVGFERRPDRRVADCHACDLARRRHVALQQSGRQAQDVGVVVEPEAQIVGRQDCAHVDLEREQVPNRVCVFGAIQSVGRRASGIRPSGGRGVELTLEPRREGAGGWRIGPRTAGWRHRAGLELVQDLLPGRGVFGDRADVHARFVETEISGQQPRVMAGDAVFVEDRSIVGGGRRSRLSCR